MNKRIKELVEQATETVDVSDKLGMPGTDLVFNKEKFAELIVRECIEVILKTDDRIYMSREGWDVGGPDHSAWTRGVLDSVEAVRESFGVK